MKHKAVKVKKGEAIIPRQRARAFMSGLLGFAAFDTYHTARQAYLDDLARWEAEGGPTR